MPRTRVNQERDSSDPMDQLVWLISTPLGNALRQSYEVEETEDGIRLKESSFIFVPSPTIPRTIARGIMVSKKDLPCPKQKTSVCNVCGFVSGSSVLVNEHPAWRLSRSALGVFKEAYTLSGGNMMFLNNGKLVFKGARTPVDTTRAVRLLLREPVEPVLMVYLVVVCAYMLKTLFVHQCCLLEEMLSRLDWCRIVTRTDEMSNAVLFHITDWSYFTPLPCAAPDIGMVSVSRRGVMNVRLAYHDGKPWQSNVAWVKLVNSIRDFVSSMC